MVASFHVTGKKKFLSCLTSFKSFEQRVKCISCETQLLLFSEKDEIDEMSLPHGITSVIVSPGDSCLLLILLGNAFS
jgi:hypothetical protein